MDIGITVDTVITTARQEVDGESAEEGEIVGEACSVT